MASLQSYSVGSAAASSVALNKPTGLQVGDLLLAFIYTDKSTLQTPSGWSAGNTGTRTTGGSAIWQGQAFWKIADSSDVAASTFSFSTSGTPTSIGGILSRWSDPNPTTPVSDSAIAFTNVSGTTISGAAITPTASSQLVMFGGSEASVSFDTYATVNHNPSWTEVTDSSPDSVMSLAMAYGSYPFTTTTGNGSFAVSSAKTYKAIYLIAIAKNSPTMTPSVLSMVLSVLRPTIAVKLNSALASAFSILAPTLAAVAPLFRNQSKNTSSWQNEDKSN